MVGRSLRGWMATGSYVLTALVADIMEDLGKSRRRKQLL